MKTNRAQLKKVASVPCLYRHAGNGSYYAVKKHEGKIHNKALKTATGEPITNLQAAKVALAAWLASLGKGGNPATLEERFRGGGQFTIPMMKDLIHASGSEDEVKEYVLKNHFGLSIQQAREQGIDLSPLETSEEQIRQEKEIAAQSKTPTLAECFDKFNVMKAANKDGTLKTYKAVRRAFELHRGRALLAKPIGAITVEDITGFFAQFPQGCKPQYFNSISMVVNQIFEMARMNRYIRENPLDLMPKNIRRRKVVMVRDVVPTIDQCEAIVESIRAQVSSHTRQQSANLCAFLHLAATGQAEATSLQWRDLDFEGDVIRVTRVKTSVPYEIPMYPFLKPFLQDLAAKKPDRKPEEKLFTIKSIKQAIYKACERLGYPPFSPRDLRKARITWLLRKGYPVELIADAQGHKDGGVLIRRVYSNVIDEAKDAYKKEQLAKLM